MSSNLDDKILNSINEFIGNRLASNKEEQDNVTLDFNDRISLETNSTIRMHLYEQLQTEISKYRAKEVKYRTLISLIHTVGSEINNLEDELDRHALVKDTINDLASTLLNETKNSEELMEKHQGLIDKSIKKIFMGDINEFVKDASKSIKEDIESSRKLAADLGVEEEKITSITLNEYFDTLRKYVNELSGIKEDVKEQKKEESEEEIEEVYTKKGFAPSKMVVNGHIKVLTTKKEGKSKFRNYTAEAINETELEKKTKALEILKEKKLVPEDSTLLTLTTLEKELLLSQMKVNAKIDSKKYDEKIALAKLKDKRMIPDDATLLTLNSIQSDLLEAQMRKDDFEEVEKRR